jgi:hypothetical protein
MGIFLIFFEGEAGDKGTKELSGWHAVGHLQTKKDKFQRA